MNINRVHTGEQNNREKMGMGLASVRDRTKKELAGIDGGTARVSSRKIRSRVVVRVIGGLDEEGLVDWFVLIS